MSAPKKIALTFEAGGDPGISRRILDRLQKARVRATIFLHGQWAEQNPALIEQMVNDGHELGNHTYTHPDLTGVDDRALLDELRQTDRVARELVGAQARPWLRPPYGAFDHRVIRLVSEMGYRLVYRDAVDGGHWPGPTTPASIVQRALASARADPVIAFHLSSELTWQALPELLDALQATGYSLVGLSDLSHVEARAPRHPDFTDPRIDPGHLQVLQPGARAWSLNLYEFGGRAMHSESTSIDLWLSDDSGAALFVGRGEQHWPAAADDRYLLSVAGVVEYVFHEQDLAQLRVVARPGDLILWPAGYRLTATGKELGRRWLVCALKCGPVNVTQ